MEKIDLLCIGNAVVDVFVRVDAAFMERRGIGEAVQHISRDQAELILQAGRDAAPVFSSGGGAANVAKIAALLDAVAAFAGCVGQDGLAAIFERDLTDAGVSCFLTRGNEKTGVCLMLSDGGETRIAAAPGAALEFTDADVREELVAAADLVMIDGYILDRRPLVRRILELSDRYGIPAVLDAASLFQIREKTEEILQYSRNYPLIVFMNADETIVFYHTFLKEPPIRKSAQAEDMRREREKEGDILRYVCPLLKRITDGELFPIFVIKLGSRGAVVVAGGNVYREETSAIIPRNTVGAGDAFCAAFLSAWIRGKSLGECAALGNKVAREILEVPGTGIKTDKLRGFAKQLKAPSRR